MNTSTSGYADDLLGPQKISGLVNSLDKLRTNFADERLQIFHSEASIREPRPRARG